MANNRLWLKCKVCGNGFYFAKYYPTTGWYTRAAQDFEHEFDMWLAGHSHVEDGEGNITYGDHLELDYEAITKPESPTLTLDTKSDS